MQNRTRRFTLVIALSLFSAAAWAQQTPTTPTELVEFPSQESQRRLARSMYTVDFFPLVNQFEPQMNAGTCGPTTAVIVLNALRPPNDSRRPIDESAFPSEMRKGVPKGMQPVAPRYTQRSFFDTRFTDVKPKARFYGAPDAAGKRDPGLQLRQLGEMLERHGLEVQIKPVADDANDDDVRKDLVANLQTPGDFVIVNYQRKVLGQPGGGHISPVAAYDVSSDSFLVLDVNPNRAPWVWVPATQLIASMRTKDTVENRGYLLVKEGAAQ